jgi:hypothetical protein
MTTTIGAITSLPPAVHNYVNGFVTRRRRIDALGAIGVALSFAFVWMLWWSLLDRFFQFPQNVRAALLGLNLLAVTIICWRPMRALIRREMSWPMVSLQIEQRNPKFGERLLTITSELLSPARHRGSPEMLDHLLQEVSVEASSDRLEKLLPISLALRPWIVVLSLAFVAVALSFIPWMDMPTLLLREIFPLANIRPASRCGSPSRRSDWAIRASPYARAPIVKPGRASRCLMQAKGCMPSPFRPSIAI